MPTPKTLTLAALVAALAFAGCGGDDEEPERAATTTAPATETTTESAETTTGDAETAETTETETDTTPTETAPTETTEGERTTTTPRRGRIRGRRRPTNRVPEELPVAVLVENGDITPDRVYSIEKIPVRIVLTSMDGRRHTLTVLAKGKTYSVTVGPGRRGVRTTRLLLPALPRGRYVMQIDGGAASARLVLRKNQGPAETSR